MGLGEASHPRPPCPCCLWPVQRSPSCPSCRSCPAWLFTALTARRLLYRPSGLARNRQASQRSTPQQGQAGPGLCHLAQCASAGQGPRPPGGQDRRMTEPQPSPAGEPVPERDAAAAEPAGPSQPAQPAEAAADGAPAAPEPAAGLPEPADQPQAPPQPQPQLQPQPDVLPSTAGASSPAKPKAPKGGGAPKDKPASQQLASIKAELLFDKTLTMSDTNGQGRILIPKARAPGLAARPGPACWGRLHDVAAPRCRARPQSTSRT